MRKSGSVAPTVTTPLVGRAHELAFLRTTFDGVCLEGRPALVTVVGDAGVGKSQARARVPLAARGRGEDARRALPRLRARGHPVASGRDAEDRSGRARDGPVRRSRREDRNARRDQHRAGAGPRTVAQRGGPGLDAGAAAAGRPPRIARPAGALPRAGGCVAGAARLDGNARPSRRRGGGPALGRRDDARRPRRARRAARRPAPLPLHGAPRAAPTRARTGAEGVGASARCRSTH